MRLRHVGSSGPVVSVVTGLQPVRLAADKSRAVVDAALFRITRFDTAEMYGDGDASPAARLQAARPGGTDEVRLGPETKPPGGSAGTSGAR